MTSTVEKCMSEQCSPAFDVKIDEVEEFVHLLNKVKTAYSGNASVFRHIVDLLIRINLEPATKQEKYDEQIILKSQLVQLMCAEPLLRLKLVNYIDHAQENPNHALHARPSCVINERFSSKKMQSTASSVTNSTHVHTGPEFYTSRKLYKKIPRSLKDTNQTKKDTKIEQLKRKVADLQQKVNESVTILKKRRRVSSSPKENDRDGVGGQWRRPNCTIRTKQSTRTRSASDGHAKTVDEIDQARTLPDVEGCDKIFSSMSDQESLKTYHIKDHTDKDESLNKNRRKTEQDGIVFSDVGKNCIVVSVKNVNDGAAVLSTTAIKDRCSKDVHGMLCEENKNTSHYRKSRRKQKKPTIKITSLISKRKAFQKSLDLATLVKVKRNYSGKQNEECKKPINDRKFKIDPIQEMDVGETKQPKNPLLRKLLESDQKPVLVCRTPSVALHSVKFSRLESIIAKLHSAKNSSSAC